jgi:plasmid maintenance system killer protein
MTDEQLKMVSAAENGETEQTTKCLYFNTEEQCLKHSQYCIWVNQYCNWVKIGRGHSCIDK